MMLLKLLTIPWWLFVVMFPPKFPPTFPELVVWFPLPPTFVPVFPKFCGPPRVPAPWAP